MATTNATATAAQVQAIVKTGASTSDIEVLLDYVVYPIVHAWIGGHSIDNETGIRTACELIMAAYFIRQRDPSAVQMPGAQITLGTYKDAERMCKQLINGQIAYDSAIRVINAGNPDATYIVRDDKPKARNPPF